MNDGWLLMVAVIRASVPNMNLDQVFEQKNEVARAVEEELAKAMTMYGYEIGKHLEERIGEPVDGPELLHRGVEL